MRPEPIKPSPMQGETSNGKAKGLKHMHGYLTVAWFLMLPISIATGWIYAIAFVSACSIYANAAAHFGAWQASKAEEAAQ